MINPLLAFDMINPLKCYRASIICPTTKQNVMPPNKTFDIALHPSIRPVMHKLADSMQNDNPKNAKNSDLPADIVGKTFYFSV